MLQDFPHTELSQGALKHRHQFLLEAAVDVGKAAEVHGGNLHVIDPETDIEYFYSSVCFENLRKRHSIYIYIICDHVYIYIYISIYLSIDLFI